ncbi:TPA: hypothetical protein SMR42_004479 [Pseudomonas putida]|nr:hypothetical protein [Pseudomonas putida]
MSGNNGFLGKFVLYIPVKLLPAALTIFFIFFLYKNLSGEDYVKYSVGLACAAIAAQIGSMWVGNAFIYHFASVSNKFSFLKHSVFLVSTLGPLTALAAAGAAIVLVGGGDAFLSVWVLCLCQAYFFFLSAVCQAGFLVKHQLVAVALQALIQVGVIVSLQRGGGLTYLAAMLALALGYASAACVMLYFAVNRFRVFSRGIAPSNIRGDIKAVFTYGVALVPWTLGMLMMAASDRFVIGYLGLENGDSYLSMKDLFVGAGGLLSMPLLMLVHPLIMKRFKEGRFDASLVEGSLGFLIIAFSLLWCGIWQVGFELFERAVGKSVVAPTGALLLAFVGVFLNCAAVYVQKRLEVHRKMRRLAMLSLGCALVGAVLAYGGALWYGLVGVALGGMLGQALYFVVVTTSIKSKATVLKAVARPLLVACVSLVLGWGGHQVLSSLLGGEPWWVVTGGWMLIFSVVSLLSFWKGVSWQGFLRSRF